MWPALSRSWPLRPRSHEVRSLRTRNGHRQVHVTTLARSFGAVTKDASAGDSKQGAISAGTSAAAKAKPPAGTSRRLLSVADLPLLRAEFHPTKNGALRPEDVRLFENGKRNLVWWRCQRHPHHEWQDWAAKRFYADIG